MTVPTSGLSTGGRAYALACRMAWRDEWRSYVALLLPFLVVVLLLASLGVTSVNVLGAVRAYVGGESLWSKARSDAVHRLRDFAASGDPQDYAAFERALAVPLGDRQAREEMSRTRPDLARARAGFLAAGNHPDDIDGMIVLFRRFGDQPMFQDALAAWTRGDELIVALRRLGERLREEAGPRGGRDGVRAVLKEIGQVNADLTHVEKRFSASLTKASRMTERLLIGSLLSTTAILSLGSIVVMRRALRRQAAHRAALKIANDRWELAAAAAELGMFELDVETNLMRLDATAAALYGLGSSALSIPRHELRALVEQDERALVKRGLDAALRSGQVFKSTYRIHRSDGALRYLEATGRLDESTAPAGGRMVGVVRDVTDERMQALMAMQRDAAEKVADARREFLSRLSHELRTPLNAVLGFAQLLALDTESPMTPARRQYVDMILNAGKQLLLLIEDVLDLTKVDAGEIGMSLQRVDVAEAVRASVALTAGVGERHGVVVIDQLSARPLWARCDPQRLQQVLVNLLTNACKYNRPGGRVLIEGREEDGHAVIEVSDTGIGMPPQDVAQLFQPFKRLAASAGTVDGTGLGLYIVKLLVERMHGSVDVLSDEGQGTRFAVRLPMAEEQAVVP